MSIIHGNITSIISKAAKTLFDADINPESISLTETKKEFKGDLTFVVFPYLRAFKSKPEKAAEDIGAFILENSRLIVSYNVVKGFLNLELADAIFSDSLSGLANKGIHSYQYAEKKKVMVEFSSPNTNKPLHLGHLRNNFLGDSVARILESVGHQVTKVNLINDRGIHICKSMLAYSLFGEGQTPESEGLKGDHFIGNFYVLFDKKFKAEVQELMNKGLSKEEAEAESELMKGARELLQKWENGDEETVALWKKLNSWVIEGFNQTYENTGINFEEYYFESDTYLLGKDLVREGIEKGVFYKKEDNSVWIDLTNEGLDDKLLLRSDGTSVYMTQDMGTAELKFKKSGLNSSIYVVGNEQDYHFQVLFKIMKALGRPYADNMFHLSYGMVDLPSGKMKSREGTVVDADELLEEVKTNARTRTQELGKIDDFNEEQAEDLYHQLALGALKFYLLKVEPKKRMLFNPEESVELQGFTGPFVQYSHARISAILRRAKDLGIDYDSMKTVSKDVSLENEEKELIMLLADFEKTTKQAADEMAPSVMANYAYALAKSYNKFYATHSIFKDELDEQVRFRVVLSKLSAEGIRKSLAMIGIEAPDRM